MKHSLIVIASLSAGLILFAACGPRNPGGSSENGQEVVTDESTASDSQSEPGKPSAKHSQAKPQANFAWCWEGTCDGRDVKVTLAKNKEDLVMGKLVFTATNKTLALAGFKLENNLILTVFDGNTKTDVLSGSIDGDGHFTGDLQWTERKLVLGKSLQQPDDYRDPFEPLNYQQLRKASKYSVTADDPLRGESHSTAGVLTDGDGKIGFFVETDTPYDARIGTLMNGESGDEIEFEDGKAIYSVASFKCQLEFFRDFLYISRLSKFNALDDYCMESEYLMAFYPLESRSTGIPDGWDEDDNEYSYDGPDYGEEFTEVGSLKAEIDGGDFIKTGRVPVDVSGKKPGIEDFFKAICKKYPGYITNASYATQYGTDDAQDFHYTVMEPSNGFFRSNVGLHYEEGMEMCFWNTPTDHSIVALNISYTGLSEFEAHPASLLVLYEYNTEKHWLTPVSVAGSERWAIDPAYLLPAAIDEYTRVSLPQAGKDITYGDFSTDSPVKGKLVWNGEWFD